MGNPAESGTHLLYYFRQENRIPKRLFTAATDLFDRRIDDPNARLIDRQIRRVVFVDDLCGSGSQAINYSKRLISTLRAVAKRDGVTLEVNYLVLVARTDALRRVAAMTDFDRVEAVLELDGTHRSLDHGSRHFQERETGISRKYARAMATAYGRILGAAQPLGWSDGQLLLGFHHNVPDNTLPIIWWDEPDSTWTPIFKRYTKIY
jgi:hypothetical protein